jgi:hypothetical protein
MTFLCYSSAGEDVFQNELVDVFRFAADLATFNAKISPHHPYKSRYLLLDIQKLLVYRDAQSPTLFF